MNKNSIFLNDWCGLPRFLCYSCQKVSILHDDHNEKKRNWTKSKEGTLIVHTRLDINIAATGTMIMCLIPTEEEAENGITHVTQTHTHKQTNK